MNSVYTNTYGKRKIFPKAFSIFIFAKVCITDNKIWIRNERHFWIIVKWYHPQSHNFRQHKPYQYTFCVMYYGLNYLTNHRQHFSHDPEIFLKLRGIILFLLEIKTISCTRNFKIFKVHFLNMDVHNNIYTNTVQGLSHVI